MRPTKELIEGNLILVTIGDRNKVALYSDRRIGEKFNIYKLSFSCFVFCFTPQSRVVFDLLERVDKGPFSACFFCFCFFMNIRGLSSLVMEKNYYLDLACNRHLDQGLYVNVVNNHLLTSQSEGEIKMGTCEA